MTARRQRVNGSDAHCVCPQNRQIQLGQMQLNFAVWHDKHDEDLALPITLDFHYVDELIAQRQALHGGYQGAPPVVDGYREGESLNRSCIIMLSAQLQTYVEEVFVEISKEILPALAADEASYRKSFSRWGNPSGDNINNLFLRIGIDRVLKGLRWQRCPDTIVFAKLRSLNELRNGIAHGVRQLRVNNKPVSLSLAQIWNYRSFVATFASRFEAFARNRALLG